MSMCGYGHTSVSAGRGQKRVSDPLELELQGVIRHPTWVLKIQLRSSVRVARVLSHWGISPAPRAG